MKIRILVAVPAAIVAAALVIAGSSASSASVRDVRTTQTPTCQSSQLKIGLKLSGNAAGTTYYAIVFSRTGTTQCALRGYPGVSFVAPSSGRQVGSAATRNPRNPVRTISVGNGHAASALLGIANHGNFDAAHCNARPVSGLRVYPPGGATAAYLPFRQLSQACSTTIKQLSITAVVAGTSGM